MYFKKGKCKKGGECQYLHLNDKLKGICFLFSKEGDCKFGSKCKFSHSGEKGRGGGSAKENEGNKRSPKGKGGKGKDPKTKTCFNCKGKGHYASNCKKAVSKVRRGASPY